MRILLAEDDAHLASLIRTTLTAAAFVTESESDGEAVQVRGDPDTFAAV